MSKYCYFKQSPEVTKGFLDEQLKVPVAPRKGIQDSLGFWIPGTEFRFLCEWDLDSGFQSLEGFRIT